jgi:tetratricopeptide (TPR) repeat protein
VLRFSIGTVVFLGLYAVLHPHVSSPALASAAVTSLLDWGGRAAWRRLPGLSHHERAAEAYRLGRFGEAVEGFSAALRLFPTRYGLSTRVLRGIARLRLYQLDSAIEDLQAGRRKARVLRREWLTGIDAELALADALSGRDGAATAELAGRVEAGHGALITALSLLRRNEFARALLVLRSPEARQSGSTLGELVRALEAWCLFETSRIVQPVDRALLFREGSGAELLSAWPGLKRFLDEQQAR